MKCLFNHLKPNSFTYPYVIDACAHLGEYRVGEKVHSEVIKHGLSRIPSVGLSLLKFYMKMGQPRLANARKIFDGLVTRTVGLWNTMISAYVTVRDMWSARKIFDEMPERDVVSWNLMITGYGKVLDVESAWEIFYRMPEKNVVSWTAMVAALANSADVRGSEILFDKMPERNEVSWNCMLTSYAQNGRWKQALDLFLKMIRSGVAANGSAFVSALSACAQLGAIDAGKWIHFHLIRDGHQLRAKVGTALVDMYAKCSDIDRAIMIFVKLTEKDVFCWNVMIKGLAVHGRVQDTMKLFDMMKREGLELNEFTFMGLLFACSHRGLVEEGQRIFYSMGREFKIQPRIEHYGCLIDLLSRDGQLEEAYKVTREMPYEPDIAVWRALLRGCTITNDNEIVNKAMERVAEFKLDGD